MPAESLLSFVICWGRIGSPGLGPKEAVSLTGLRSKQMNHLYAAIGSQLLQGMRIGGAEQGGHTCQCQNQAVGTPWGATTQSKQGLPQMGASPHHEGKPGDSSRKQV